jgi:hypothetical protein
MLLNAGADESLVFDEAGASVWSLLSSSQILTSGFQRFLPSRAQALATAMLQMG